MNREDIMKLEAGRELNALVAINIMGWKKGHGTTWIVRETEKGDLVQAWKLRPYSTDISAAWEVVTKIQDCLHLREHGEQGEWEASFCGLDAKGHGETAALAICRAGLLAVME